MNQFEISLKNAKIKLYKQLTWLALIVHILIFLYLSLFSASKSIRGISIASIILIAIYFFFRYYFKTKWQPGFNPIFSICMITWIGMEKYWLAAIPCILDILSSIALRKLTVAFSSERITYPSFPSRNILWTELSNVILKDGLLTIDFKNNKIIQQHIEETTNPVNEKDFNDFCRAQLNK